MKETDIDIALFSLPRACELLDDCITITKDFGPDLIIYDCFSLEGYFVGKLLNIPYWNSISTMIGPLCNLDYLEERFLDPVNQNAILNLKKKFNILISKDDVELVSNGLMIPGQRNLVWSYKQIVPSNYMLNRKNLPYSFVGNLSKKLVGPKARTNSTPIIYLSFSGVVMDYLWSRSAKARKDLIRFFNALASKWKDKEIKIIFASQGKDVVEKYPDNWDVRPNVSQKDQGEFLSQADLFITHGGNNSFHEAILQKVPMIVIPFLGDQMLVARLAEKLGIGIDLTEKTSISLADPINFLNNNFVSRLDQATSEILNNRKYRDNYEKLDLKSVLKP